MSLSFKNIGPCIAGFKPKLFSALSSFCNYPNLLLLMFSLFLSCSLSLSTAFFGHSSSNLLNQPLFRIVFFGIPALIVYIVQISVMQFCFQSHATFGTAIPISIPCDLVLHEVLGPCHWNTIVVWMLRKPFPSWANAWARHSLLWPKNADVTFHWLPHTFAFCTVVLCYKKIDWEL